MYVRKIHNLETGHIVARGFDLAPGDTIESLVADELETFPSAWDKATTKFQDSRNAVIRFREGQSLVTRVAPDLNISIHIST